MKRRDEVTVGILITIAVVVLVLGTLWLVRGGLKSGYPLYTRFGWGQNLKQGQPVLLAGVTVGNVGDVNLRRAGLPRRHAAHRRQVPGSQGLDGRGEGGGNLRRRGGRAHAARARARGVVRRRATPFRPAPSAADIDLILSRTDSIARATTMLLTALQQQVVAAGTLKDIHKLVASLAAAFGRSAGRRRRAESQLHGDDGGVPLGSAAT